MTKKDFVFFAQFVVQHDLSWQAVDELVMYFSKKNPRFDEERFRGFIKTEAAYQQHLVENGDMGIPRSLLMEN